MISSLLFNIVLEVLATANRKVNGIKLFRLRVEKVIACDAALFKQNGRKLTEDRF